MGKGIGMGKRIEKRIDKGKRIEKWKRVGYRRVPQKVEQNKRVG